MSGAIRNAARSPSLKNVGSVRIGPTGRQISARMRTQDFILGYFHHSLREKTPGSFECSPYSIENKARYTASSIFVDTYCGLRYCYCNLRLAVG
jgi:hypothetical protein